MPRPSDQLKIAPPTNFLLAWPRGAVYNHATERDLYGPMLAGLRCRSDFIACGPTIASRLPTLTTNPPMVADELRRQADQFIDLANMQAEIGRDPAERTQRDQRRRSEPEPLDEFEQGDLIET